MLDVFYRISLLSIISTLLIGCSSNNSSITSNENRNNTLNVLSTNLLSIDTMVNISQVYTSTNSPQQTNFTIQPKQIDFTSKQAGDIVGSVYVDKSLSAELNMENIIFVIDSGAVKNNVEISVVEINKTNTADIPDNMENITQGHKCYRMLPDGQKFEKDITIAIKYDSTQLPYGYTEEDIFTFFYNEEIGLWQQVERDSIDREKQLVYSRTNHFTDYINGILKTPESSDAMAYTPTSIKDLKAADPMNGITLMAPPEANNKGTANLTYPLNIPAGRRGMQPNLNISYNSAGGSGWLGLGWSLNISEITVETRWGVPIYDQNKETETYLLDGETLVGSYYDENNQFRLKKPVYRRDYENRSNCDSIFYRRVEGSFQRIIRHGNNPKNYWWEVINKDGTKYVYMTSLTDINGNIAKWYLTQTEDTYGNIVSYEYATKYPQGILTSDSFSYVGKQLVPSTITYTGNKNTSESGQYNLTFIYADKKDKTTSLCYGLEEINYYLLDKIQVKYKAEQIKEYYFGYKIGDFGKSLLSCVIEVFEDSAKYQKYKAQNLHEDTNILLANIYERSEIQPISTANVYLHLKHNFDYYQMNSNKIFGTPHTFSNVSNINSGNINSGTLHKTLLPFKESTNFGGTKSSNWHVSGGINFGLFHRIWLKDLSVGGHYSYINDKSEGLMMLVDVNGDGYPDKLYKKNGFLRCRLQMPGTDQFGSMRTISGVKNFQKSHGSTHCWGFEASAVSIGAGGSWNDSRNSTTTYVSDVNGDGLIDIVDNGKVYLNTGGLVFSDITEKSTISIGGSCDDDTISFSGTVDTTLFDNGIKIIEYVHCDTIIKEVKQENDSVTLIKEISNCTTYYDTIEYNYPKRYEPNVDLVRMWKAPYSGNIRLHWTAKLTDSLNDQRLATRANDGVWISTHKKKDTILIASDTILPYGQSIRDTTIAINEGEVLYFRINSLNKRLYDKVEWNPNIDYVSATLRDGRHITSGAELNSRDVNRDYVYKFNYADDFMLNGKNEIAAGSDSSNTFFNKYTIETNIKGTTPLSQDIQYVIYKRDTNTNSTESIVKSKTFTKGTIPNYVDTFETGAILSSKVLLFTLKTKTAGQIKWSDLDATVKVSLFYSTDSVVNKRINDTTAENSYVYYPVIEKQKTYDYLVLPSAKITGFSYIDRLKVNIQTTDNSSINTILVMTIKDSNGLIGNALVPINNNIGSISYQLSNLDPNKIFYIDYYTSSVSLSEKINRITTRINTSQTEYFSGLYGKYSEDNDKHFGTLYRGWGQFGYKDTSSTHFIKEELLNIPAYYSDENFITSSIPDEENINVIDTNTIDAESCPESLINGYYNPLSESFFEMTADGLNCRWKSYGDIVTATRTIMSNDNTSPTNTYEDEEGGDSLQVDFTQSPLPVVFQDQSIKAVNKYNLNKGFGYTIDKYSSNNGTNSLLGDYIDMNGDKYPDIVSSKNIQYSKAQGGLGNNKSGFPENELTKSKTSTHGWTFGGTFLRVEKVLSNNPRNAGSYVVAPQSSPLSFGTTAGEDYTSHTIVDINGDGLPDIVFTNGDIKYNMGYKFTEKRSMAGILGLNTSYSSVVSSNPSFNVLNTSISGGLGRTQTNNRNTHVLIDINGDGLPDIIVGDSIFINKGNNSYESFFDSSLNVITSKTTTYNANISGTLDYPFVIFLFR